MIAGRWGAAMLLGLALCVGACDTEGELTPRSATGQRVATRPAATTVTGGVATDDVEIQPTPTPSPAPLIPSIQRVELSTDSVTLARNPYDSTGNPKGVPGSLRLLATVLYADGVRNDLVRWTSSDPSLVTVTEQGEVSPTPPLGTPQNGSALVVAAAQYDPTITATCTVTVVP